MIRRLYTQKTVRMNPKLNTSAAPSVLYSTQPIGTVFNTAPSVLYADTKGLYCIQTPKIGTVLYADTKDQYCKQTPKIGAVYRHQKSVLYTDTKNRCCMQTPKICAVCRHQRSVLYTDTKDRCCIPVSYTHLTLPTSVYV